MDWIINHADDIVIAITAVIAAASAIAALTPTPRDDAFIGKLRKIISVLALNVGNAREQGK